MKVQNADIGGGSNHNVGGPMARYRKKKVYIAQKVGGPEIRAAHKNQKAQ